MQPPEALTVHAVPHPNPKVQRVGFELHDSYVEHVYAGRDRPHKRDAAAPATPAVAGA